MKRMAFAAALLALAMTALPGQASATGADPWNTYPCPSGELKAAETVVYEDAVGLTMPGVIDCSVSPAGPQFAVVVFRPDSEYGIFDGDVMKQYATSGGKTTFQLDAFGEFGPMEGDASVCLMPDRQTRLSCVYISPKITVTPLSTSDPSVQKPVKHRWWDRIPPGCGTCWRIQP